MNINHVHDYSINLEDRDIFLHSHINGDEESGVDYRSATRFIKNLYLLSKKSKASITIHMDLCGGQWSNGLAMYDAIKYCGCKTNLIVYGRAESMSTVIMQAATTRVLMPNSYLLVHYGYVNSTLSVAQYMAEAKFHHKEGLKMLDIYAERCQFGEYFQRRKNVKRELKRLITTKQEWYLDPEEAIYYGFADKIIS